MKSIRVNRDNLNIQKLNADLQDLVGIGYIGMSTLDGVVVVYFKDDTASELVLAAADVVANHDASVLTAEQAAEQARQQVLSAARASHPTGLDLGDFSTSPADVQTLADLVAWLELEIRDLQGL